MSVAIQSEARMNVYELSLTPEFNRLSPKMAMWLMAYVQNFIDTGAFDPLSATKAAYQCGSDENARTFGYQLLANSKIIAALDCFFGNSPERASLRVVTTKADQNRKRLLKEVEANLEAADEGSVAAQRLLAQKERLLFGQVKDGLVDSQTPGRKYAVGDLFTQRGHTGRVLAIDAEGKPTQVEEILSVR